MEMLDTKETSINECTLEKLQLFKKMMVLIMTRGMNGRTPLESEIC